MSTTEDPSVDESVDDGSATTIVIIIGGVVVLAAFIGIIVFCSCLGGKEPKKGPIEAKIDFASALLRESGEAPT